MEEDRRATFLLVHGSWGGGWTWKQVADVLTARDYDVLAPTLTGLGETAHLMTETVGPEVHILDVMNLADFRDLRDIVLVGHSYGALIATAAACRMRGRIRSLVVLDGFLVRSGSSLFDLHPEVEGLMSSLRSPNIPWQILPAPGELLGIGAGPALSEYERLSRPMPWASHATPLADDLAALSQLDRHYVRCLDFPIFAETIYTAEREGWRRHELEAGHMVMTTHPTELASLLSDIAERKA